jgi:hypothetical protein
MAIDKNLIQVQSDLQDPAVKSEDLIKYANGSNPDVPSFLALMEMSRRKQIEDSSQNFNASNQKSVKDQLASALTAPTQLQGGLGGLPAGQVNPAAAPAGVNMAAPAPAVNPAAAPQQVDPTAMPQQPQMAAGGGLMSLPVDHFNASSYAGGGIVAFAGGGSAEDQWAQQPGGLNVLKEEAAPAPEPTSYQGILSSLPQVQPISMPEPKELTSEQAYADIKKNQVLAGVSEDPFADVKLRQAKLEERQIKAYEQGGLDRLLHQLTAFATADPSKGFAYAGAVSAEASRVLEREQQALRDKQEAAQIEFQRSLAKEEDAKKRGDAAGIQAAVENQKKAQQEYAKLSQAQDKLGIDRENVAAHLYGTQETATTQREANKGMLGYHNRMADIAETTKGQTIEDRKVAKAEAATNSDAQYRREAERIGPNGGLEPGSAEFNAALQRMYQIREFHFKAAKAELPPIPPLPAVIELSKKPGWWARNAPEILGGTPSTAVTSGSPHPPDVQKVLDKYK